MVSTNWIQLIKNIAEEARKAAKPSTFMTASVANTSPLKIRINQKLEVEEDFLVLTETIFDRNLKKGDVVLVIRQEGGQKFAIIDKVVK